MVEVEGSSNLGIVNSENEFSIIRDVDPPKYPQMHHVGEHLQDEDGKIINQGQRLLYRFLVHQDASSLSLHTYAYTIQYPYTPHPCLAVYFLSHSVHLKQVLDIPPVAAVTKVSCLFYMLTSAIHCVDERGNVYTIFATCLPCQPHITLHSKTMISSYPSCQPGEQRPFGRICSWYMYIYI